MSQKCERLWTLPFNIQIEARHTPCAAPYGCNATARERC